MLIKLTSKFRPFSFDEMTKPLILYKEAYDKYQEKYDDLVMNTEKWRDVVNETGSPEAYAMYKRYSNQLNAAVDDFMLEMTMRTGRLFLGLRRGYASDIIPIENAKKAYDKMVETREKIKSVDDSAVFLNKYNSIDNFLHGQVADNSYVSGNKLYTKLSAQLEAYGRSEEGKLEISEAGISKGYNDIYVLKNGYTMADVQEVLNNKPNSKAALHIRSIIDGTLKSVLFDSLTKNDKDFLYEGYIMPAVYSGLSKPAYLIIGSGKEQVERKEEADRNYNLNVRKYNDERTDSAWTKSQHIRDQFVNLVANGVSVSAARELTGFAGQIDESKVTNLTSSTNDRDEQAKLQKKVNEGGGINYNGNTVINPDGTVTYELNKGGYIRYNPKTEKLLEPVTYYDGNEDYKKEALLKIKGSPTGNFSVTIKDGKVVATDINPREFGKHADGSTDEKEQTKRYALPIYVNGKAIIKGSKARSPITNDVTGKTPEKLKLENPKAYKALSDLARDNGLILENYRIYTDNHKDFYLMDVTRFPKGTKKRPLNTTNNTNIPSNTGNTNNTGRTTNSGQMLGK